MADSLLNNGENVFQRIKQSADQGLLTVCLLVVFILMTLVVIALPLSQIVVGSIYIHQCPMDYLIPIHLIVTGASIFILLIIIILEILIEKSSLLRLVRIVLQFFCLGWFITGSIWTFRAKKTVQFTHSDYPHTYCHYSVFECALLTLFMSYGLLVGTLCYGTKRSK